MASPVETKVIAAAAGAFTGGSLGTFVLWVLGVTVWHQSAAADVAEKALAAVPGPVAAIVVSLAASLIAAVSGWAAPHTPRAAATTVTLTAKGSDSVGV